MKVINSGKQVREVSEGKCPICEAVLQCETNEMIVKSGRYGELVWYFRCSECGGHITTWKRVIVDNNIGRLVNDNG